MTTQNISIEDTDTLQAVVESDEELTVAQVVALDARLEAMVDSKPLSFWRIAIMRLRRDRLTMVAMAILAVIALLSLGAPWISDYVLKVEPGKTNLLGNYAPPSAEHWLGTDDLGRDQFSRLLYGGRVSLAIAVVGTLVTLLLGITLGMAAAYFGKFTDDAIIALINVLTAIPALFLLLLLGSLYDISPAVLTVLFGLLGWPFITRLVRSTVFSLKEREFVIASQALGGSSASVLGRHVLPNVIPIVIIATARRVGTLILAESALSFLGFGVQPPTPTWGNMLTEAQGYLFRPEGYHLIWAPGLMITLTVLCLYIIGDGLRDAMDPRLK